MSDFLDGLVQVRVQAASEEEALETARAINPASESAYIETIDGGRLLPDENCKIEWDEAELLEVIDEEDDIKEWLVSGVVL